MSIFDLLSPPPGPPPAELPWSDDEIAALVRDAVLKSEKAKVAADEKHRLKALKAGKTINPGKRGGITSGQHLNAFRDVLDDVAKLAQVSHETSGKQVGLPGYYRATKNWDWVQVRGNRLVTAVELKSMAGSESNNTNNRIEEALGLSFDFWKAYHAGLLGDKAKRDEGIAPRRPWLGFIYVMTNGPGLTHAISCDPTRFPVHTDFKTASRIKRFELLGDRLVQTEQFDAVAFMLTNPDGTTNEGPHDISFATFARKLYRHLRDSAPPKPTT